MRSLIAWVCFMLEVSQLAKNATAAGEQDDGP